jgi:Xaa-Pro aminopeptidase
MRYIWARPSPAALSFLRTSVGFPGRASHASSAPAVFRTKRASQNQAGPPSVEDMETVDTTSRLAALRSLMKDRGVDVYGISAFFFRICPP